MSRPASNRRLRRLRGALGLLAASAALCVLAAARLESTGRAVAAIGALACVIAWLVLLEMEGRIADSLERRGMRRHRPIRRRLPKAAARRMPRRAA